MKIRELIAAVRGSRRQSAVLAFGGLAAIAGAFAHSWPEKWLYILTFVSWESAAGTFEHSSAIDAYEERDEEW